ncbi:MAG: SPOR domain-containing protein [Planctomycetes bacterium]|nr:SPOR domain-containing protein [Planctomycetota bacterium]
MDTRPSLVMDIFLVLAVGTLTGCQAPRAEAAPGAERLAGADPSTRWPEAGDSLDGPADTGLPPLPTASPAGWCIQFGAFQHEPNARRRAEEAARREPGTSVIPVAREGRTLWCVRSPAYPSREAAAAALRELVVAGGVGEVCLVGP